MIVRSGGALRAIPSSPAFAEPTNGSGEWSGGAWFDHDPQTYAALYRSQPNVRTCVDFLARNIAQLGLHVYRRVSDTDRERLTDHQLADWLGHPTPATTRYRLIETLVQDFAIFWNAYWLKVRLSDRIALQRLPPDQIEVVGGLVPAYYVWTPPSGIAYSIAPENLVVYRGYDPTNPLLGLSPLETLRRLLAEDVAAQNNREAFWRNAARIEGVVERPAAAPKWSPEQTESWRNQWRTKFAGEAGVGQVAVLQEGMTYKSIAFSPRQAEYVSVRKLTREECAAAYHIPLPMVGILDHATFSNIREQHKQLYQDSLGPWLRMIEEEIERQLLPECRDTDRIYVEFNIAEKLSGSFEEQAAALQTLVGAPIMTRNEGRARLNLPALDEQGANQLVRPLNSTTEAEPSTPPAAAPAAAAATVLPFRLPDDRAIARVLEATWARQAVVVGKVDAAARAGAFDAARWRRELTDDLLPLYRAVGHDDSGALRRAERLATIVTTDTQTHLANGTPAFGVHRKAADYDP